MKPEHLQLQGDRVPVDSPSTFAPAHTTSARRVSVMLLSAPVIHSVYFLVAYFFVEIACSLGLLQGQVLGMSGVKAVVVGFTLISLALIVATAWPSYRAWRQTDQRSEVAGENTVRFMALNGLWLALLFGLVTLLMGLAVFLLYPCRAV